MMVVLEALAWTVVVMVIEMGRMCVWGGESQKENDLVPTFKCGKCHNKDSVKGCGNKEAGDICSKDGKEVWITQEELSSPNFRVQEIKIKLTKIGQGQSSFTKKDLVGGQRNIPWTY